MNGFTDPVLGEMAAVDCASCAGCAYERDKEGCRAAPSCRIEGEIRSIIWVPAADAPRAPKPVRLTDEQINEIETVMWDRFYAAGHSFGREEFARAIEAAVLRANNLETPE